MPEIEYKDIKAHIEKCRAAVFDPVYLVHGDDYLRDQVVDVLIAALLPDPEDRRLHLETLDSAEGGGVFDAIERINTLSLLAPGKVIRLKDGGLFSTGGQADKQIDKIKDVWEQGNAKKAASLFLDLLARREGQLADAVAGDIAGALKLESEAAAKFSWIAEVAGYCEQNGLFPQSAADAAGALKSAVERGFPKNHHILLISDSADRRTALYKSIKTCGTIINCVVPIGSRKAEQDEQRRVLSRMMQHTFSRYGKTAEPGVFDRIFDRTGFDPRGFSISVEKLVHYVGDAGRITVAHVDQVIDKSREDPIYAFTGALAERRTVDALQFIASLLDNGYHYMQLLSAMINQVRKLLVVKTFTASREGSVWQPGASFDRFKSQVMPEVIKFDAALLDHVRQRDEHLAPKGAKPSKSPTELQIARTPNNPYPVYQLFLQSDRYTLPEIHAAVVKLHEADKRLKSTGQSPKTVLEHLVFSICRPDTPDDVSAPAFRK